MKASEFIKDLQEHIKEYGDWEIVIRHCNNIEDEKRFIFYGSEQDEVFVISGMSLR